MSVHFHIIKHLLFTNKSESSDECYRFVNAHRILFVESPPQGDPNPFPHDHTHISFPGVLHSFLLHLALGQIKHTSKRPSVVWMLLHIFVHTYLP